MLKDIFLKTFGGLTKQYYFRQLVLGLIIPAFVVFMAIQSPQPMSMGMMVFVIVSTVLYPYSRFVYESVIGFILGDNVFAFNALIFIFAKIITMMICWVCAIFIAPVGLIYLYFANRKSQE